MGAVANGNTPATEVIFDRVVAKLEADEFDYPNDVVFIPADHLDFGAMIRDSLRENRPSAVVYPDGRERLIPAPEMTAQAHQPRS
jgi:hypothetical protein